MQLEQVKTAMDATPKGANVILEWVRPCKVKKSVTDNITKSVRMVGRTQIDYDNQKAVQEKRENGDLPAENQGLSWGFFPDYDNEPWHICLNQGVKKTLEDGTPNPEYYKVTDSTTHYVRLYNGTSKNVKAESHFFRNGQEVTMEDIKTEVLASEKDKPHGDCFNCKVENMTRIHSESEWMMIVVGQVKQEKVAASVPVPAKVLATIQ